jgi:hypothetical protein
LVLLAVAQRIWIDTELPVRCNLQRKDLEPVATLFRLGSISPGINLTTGSNNIDISNKGVARDDNTIRIGTTGTQTGTYIAGIRGTTVAGGIGC